MIPRPRRPFWLGRLAGLVLAASVLGSCTPDVVFAEDSRVAFLGIMNSDSGHRLYLKGDTGIDKVALNEDVWELQGLGGDLVAIVTLSGTDRFLSTLNVVTGQRQTLRELGKNQRPPLVSSDGTRILTVVKRLEGHRIEIHNLVAPYDTERVAVSEQSVSPRSWPCSREYVYLVAPDTERIMRLSLRAKTLKDITPRGLDGHSPNWISASCDARTMAISATPPYSKRYDLHIYRDGRLVRKIVGDHSVIEPNVSIDGDAVVYLDGYGKPQNRIMQYRITEDRITEVVGPTGSFAGPVILQ